MNQPKQQLTVVDGIRKMQDEFKLVLPPHIPPERFTRNAITVVNSNPEFLKDDVDRRSLYGAVMKAAQDGLILDGREAALVVYKGKCSYQPMVEGIMKLVRNSGDVSTISVHVVKENDSFDYELGDNERMIHKPAFKDRGKTVGAYSIVTLKNGDKSREWMDVDQLEAIRKRSYAAQKGPWVTDTDEMYRKTVFKRHAKRLPKSTDIDDLLRRDDDDDVPLEGITRISLNTPEPTPDAPSKQTRASAKVKAAAAPPVYGDPNVDVRYDNRDKDDGVIDVEVERDEPQDEEPPV